MMLSLRERKSWGYSFFNEEEQKRKSQPKDAPIEILILLSMTMIFALWVQLTVAGLATAEFSDALMYTQQVGSGAAQKQKN